MTEEVLYQVYHLHNFKKRGLMTMTVMIRQVHKGLGGPWGMLVPKHIGFWQPWQQHWTVSWNKLKANAGELRLEWYGASNSLQSTIFFKKKLKYGSWNVYFKCSLFYLWEYLINTLNNSWRVQKGYAHHKSCLTSHFFTVNVKKGEQKKSNLFQINLLNCTLDTITYFNCHYYYSFEETTKKKQLQLIQKHLLVYVANFKPLEFS